MLSTDKNLDIEGLWHSYQAAANDLERSWTSTMHRSLFFKNLNLYYNNFLTLRNLLKSADSQTYLGINDLLVNRHAHFVKDAQANFTDLIRTIRNDFKMSLKQFENSLNHEIYYTYAYLKQSEFESKHDHDFTAILTQFCTIKNSPYFNSLLTDLACTDQEFHNFTMEIEKIIENITVVRKKTARQIAHLKLLPKDVKIVLCAIKRPYSIHQRGDYLDLDYIIKKNLLKHLPPIFLILCDAQDIDDNPLCTQDQLKYVQTRIYKAIAAYSLKLKIYHAGRIIAATLLAIALTPFSLLLTIPWIQKRKKETFIEKRVLSESDYNDLITYRRIYKEKPTTLPSSGLFNRQHELKKVVNIKLGRVKILMRSEQALRFDAWLESKNNLPAKELTFNTSPRIFNQSKKREKESIEKNKRKYLRHSG